MADTTLTLGGVAFADFEIPEKIEGGGKQMLNVHKLVGGTRIVDAMGPDPDNLKWTGKFRGPNAVARCQTLDAMRGQGAQLELSWGGFTYTVVIESFTFSYERFYEIAYSIDLKVVVDPAAQGGGASPLASLDDLIGSDLDGAFGFFADAAGAASDVLSGVQTALDAAGSLVGAPIAALANIGAVFGSAADQIGGFADGLDIALPLTIGGDPLDMAAGLSNAASLVSQQAATRNMAAYVGRAALNLSLAL